MEGNFTLHITEDSSGITCHTEGNMERGTILLTLMQFIFNGLMSIHEANLRRQAEKETIA